MGYNTVRVLSQAQHQAEHIVGEHSRVREVALGALVLLVRLSLNQTVEHQAAYDHPQSVNVVFVGVKHLTRGEKLKTVLTFAELNNRSPIVMRKAVNI